MSTRLILVDGIIGSGKSTTAQWLYRLLSEHGVPAVWHHEQDVGHPLYEHHQLEAAARLSGEACLAFHRAALGRWQTVADRAGSEPVVVLESSFLQAPVASMHLSGCAPEAIVEQVGRTARVVDALRPLLVYLRPHDVAASVRWICEQRGPEFVDYLRDTISATPYGARRAPVETAAVTVFIEELAVLFDETVASLGLEVLTADAGREPWETVRRRIAARLGVPVAGTVEPLVPAGDPSAFAGRYRDTEHDQELTVVLGDDGLRLASGARLLPTAPDTFDLEGLSVELTFEHDGDVAERIRCQTRLANLGSIWERVQDVDGAGRRT